MVLMSPRNPKQTICMGIKYFLCSATHQDLGVFGPNHNQICLDIDSKKYSNSNVDNNGLVVTKQEISYAVANIW